MAYSRFKGLGILSQTPTDTTDEMFKNALALQECIENARIGSQKTVLILK